MAVTAASVGTGPSQRQVGPYTKVTIRNGKTISINDHIYISAPWIPGGGEPYIIGRVMEFVIASSARSGAAALASSSGTLQVRVNVFQRQRDISHKATSDSKLLLATMHSDVYALENVRGLCEVRHRELIGDAPQISAWKKMDDHFYYYQLYDRYIHRHYDVIPTTKLQNVPPEVLETLRKRYSFVIAEVGMAGDLCDAVRGCAVCHQWASSPESVRCDTCKKFFHMRCLNPPLAAKPAKGYSWTCAPCSKRHEQTVAMEHGSAALEAATSGSITPAGSGSQLSENPTNESLTKGRTAATVQGSRARGAQGKQASGSANHRVREFEIDNQSPRCVPSYALAGRKLLAGSASNLATPESSPAPERTMDDVRGVRCYEKWPYRYFGQHTVAKDILDPHDSIYPRATTRLGQKYQSNLITWEQQKELGLGVALGVDSDHAQTEEPPAATTKKSRSKQKKQASKKDDKNGALAQASSAQGTPIGTPVLSAVALPEGDTASARESAVPALPAPVREFERGGDESVDVICNVSASPDALREERTNYLDAYMASAAYHFRPHPSHNIDFINHAVKIYNDKQYQPIVALQAVSKSNSEDLRIVHWNSKERKAFEQGLKDYGAEMKHLKQLIPTKQVADIVRYFAIWKNEKQREQHEGQRAAAAGKSTQASNGHSQERADDSLSPREINTRAVSPALSVHGEETIKATPNITCKVCGTNSSSKWYKGSYIWANRFMCSVCGVHWRKYAAEPVNTEITIINPRKHALEGEDSAAAPPGKAAKVAKASAVPNGNDAHRSTSTSATPLSAAAAAVVAAAAKVASTSATPTPPPPPVQKPDPIRCVMCRKLEPKKKLQQCYQCSLSVHQGCFGLSDEEVAKDIWFCDPCTNERTLDNALNPSCILCPQSIQGAAKGSASGVPLLPLANAPASTTAPSRAGRSRPSAANTAKGNGADAAVAEPLNSLDAVKPTECNNWAHLICAAWMPDVLFTDPVQMKPIEGAGSLPLWRYGSLCEICDIAQGACIQCSEPGCKRTFHVSCGFTNNAYSFGFEINPVKMSRRDTIITASFKSETGHWTCLAFCRGHKDLIKDKPLIYDFCELDAKTGLTALQTYVRTHKSVMPAPLSNTSSGSGKNAQGIHASATTSANSQGNNEPMHALLRRAKRFDAMSSEGYARGSKSGQDNDSRAQSTKTPPASASVVNGTAVTPSPRSMSKINGVSPSSLRKSSGVAQIPFQDKATPVKKEGSEVRSGKKQCLRCNITFSPFWWPVAPGTLIDPPEASVAKDDKSSAVVASPGSHCCNLCRPQVLKS
ncbi:unnamed protein product [Sympodiomycopsis kandeliae]